MRWNIIAGIVSFNPDINKLKENINTSIQQVNEIIVVDNGSKNVFAVEELCENYDRITLVKIGKNKGIAFALNTIFKFAYARGAQWVLTLDQDSCIYSDFIEQCKTQLNQDKVASICTLERDRNCDFDVEYDKTVDVEEVNFAITSGNLVRLSAWKEVRGFNESLFIDSVDFEFSYRLREAGYSIIRINKVLISHELGDSKKHGFLGMKPVSYNHSPFRKYYIFRNQVYEIRFVNLSKERHLRRTIMKNLIKILLYEDQKLMKLKAGIKGIFDGMRMTEYDYPPIDIAPFERFAGSSEKIISLSDSCVGGGIK